MRTRNGIWLFKREDNLKKHKNNFKKIVVKDIVLNAIHLKWHYYTTTRITSLRDKRFKGIVDINVFLPHQKQWSLAAADLQPKPWMCLRHTDSQWS